MIKYRENYPREWALLGIPLKANRVVRVSKISSDPLATGFPHNHSVKESFMIISISREKKISGKFFDTLKKRDPVGKRGGHIRLRIFVLVEP